MMRRTPSSIAGNAVLWRVLIGVMFLAGAATDSRALQLVTEQEAALPDDRFGASRGGPTRAPSIDFIMPAKEAGVLKSPFNLKIRFIAHGGARVNPESVLVTYKKLPAVDLTQRVAPFIRANGVEINGVELPAGIHRFRLDVSDTEGRKATDHILIQIVR
jgi:hypothetical protein